MVPIPPLLEDGDISQHTFTYEDLGMERWSCPKLQVVMPRKMLQAPQCRRMKPALVWKRRFSTLVLANVMEKYTIKEGVELARQFDCGWFCPCKLQHLQEVQVWVKPFYDPRTKRKVAQMVMEDLQPLPDLPSLWFSQESSKSTYRSSPRWRKFDPSRGISIWMWILSPS